MVWFYTHKMDFHPFSCYFFYEVRSVADCHSTVLTFSSQLGLHLTCTLPPGWFTETQSGPAWLTLKNEQRYCKPQYTHLSTAANKPYVSCVYVCMLEVLAVLDSLLYLSLSHANDSIFREAYHGHIIFSLCPSLWKTSVCDNSRQALPPSFYGNTV